MIIRPMPEEMAKRVTLHSSRAGGATDAFAEKGSDPRAVELTRQQGRWLSDCFRIYIRLRRKRAAPHSCCYY